MSTAFDDAPDGNPTTYFGDRRTLVIDLGGASANAVRLDFLNDRSWTFLSEISFSASAAIQRRSGDGAASDATPGLSLQRQGSADADQHPDFLWAFTNVGGANAGLVTPVPVWNSVATTFAAKARTQSPIQPLRLGVSAGGSGPSRERKTISVSVAKGGAECCGHAMLLPVTHAPLA